jgi:glyoxylase-like metal-dependent hydrolase (beta-lactamase superfamily II)
MTALPSYFVQSLSGRDHALGDPQAAGMANLAYLVGERDAGQCVLVDPSWDPLGLLARAEQDGMRVTGVLLTHYHGDHAGGPLWGERVRGVPELVAAGVGPIMIHEADRALVCDRCKLDPARVRGLREGEVLRVGDLAIEVLHTPGHSPGSACFLAREALLTGDTIFVEGFGRVDLPTSDPTAMLASLQRLLALPGSLVVYPGHDYGGLCAPLASIAQRDPPLLWDL